MDINPEDETSYTTSYWEALLKCVENEYSARHQLMTVNKPECVLSINLIPPAKAPGTGQSSFDSYDLSSDDEESVIPNIMTQTTPRWSVRAAHLLTAPRLYFNSTPEATKNWVQINQNLNNYHSDPLEISSTFWIPDITDWWPQQVDTHSK